MTGCVSIWSCCVGSEESAASRSFAIFQTADAMVVTAAVRPVLTPTEFGKSGSGFQLLEMRS